MVNEGVRRAYLLPDNVLRGSILNDPAGARKNTGDNTPAVIHVEIVPGSRLEVKLAAKRRWLRKQGAPGNVKSRRQYRRLGRSHASRNGGWLVPTGYAWHWRWRTAEKAAVLAKESLMGPIDIHELRARGPGNRIEELRLEIIDRANALGIGAQGLGGLTTVLDVKILDYPTQAASLPVAMIPNCAATRHAHFTLDGSGVAEFTPPSLSEWPDIIWDAGPRARKVNLDTILKRISSSGSRVKLCCSRHNVNWQGCCP